ncbi:MAG: HupE/UreJ family protein [Flavobacteriaceae bacterium]|nr:HupE/UreJ family protein [Flavobacteriaceae bacterium]
MNLFRNLVYSIVLFAIGLSANAHEVRPAYLQIEQTRENSFHVVWKIPATGMTVPKIYLELPENWKMTSNNASLISNALRQEWNYELNDNIHGGEITFDGLQNTIMDVLVTIKLLNGVKFSGLVKPKNPIYVIPDTPSVWNISKTYLKLGIEHILFGFDHLLFVLALVLITFGGWRILKTITAFTIAHSITLSLAALGFVYMPSASIEAVIALSIVFLAVELVHFIKGHVGLTAKYPWVVAFIFGLLHGFGFAGALTELGLPQTDIPFALAFFNIGVELGQLVFVMVILVIIFLVNKIKIKPKNWVKLVPAYSIGIIATMWCFERVLSFW